MLEHSHPFSLGSSPVDIELPKLFCIHLSRLTMSTTLWWKTNNSYFECINVVRENDYFIAALFVVLDKKLACLKLFGVHAVQKHAASTLLLQVLAIELWGHWTPNFGALRKLVLVEGNIYDVTLDKPERWQYVL